MGRIEREGLRLTFDEREKFASLVALTRLLLERLQGPGPAPASDAAVEAHRLLDLSLAGNPPPHTPACFKGCGHCCRVYVSATAPEAFALARAIGEAPRERQAEVKARLHAAEAATGGRDWSRDPFFTHPCPLLEDGACSLHPTRPDACRGVSSYSAVACQISIAALVLGRDEAIPRVEEHALLRALHAHALWAALAAAGLPHVYYSLNPALLRALETPDAEARWLAGEDIFAGVPIDSTAQDLPHALVAATIDALVSGATGALST